jgi:hypothetical protein
MGADSPVDELVANYRIAASAHRRATARGDHVAANGHHEVVAAIYRELRRRGITAQNELLPLLKDPDPAIKGWAAAHALEFAPDVAEPVLAEIASGRGMQALNAEMTLDVWRKGKLSFP